MAGIRHRRRVDQGQVQAHAKAGRSMRDGDRVGGRRSSHHQAGRRQHAFAMRDLDRRVDLAGETKIVGGDDEAVQVARARSRRKAKNSRPSRKRRAIIEGLSAISDTISAIFEARK